MNAGPANLLQVLEVASPCTVAWESMQGGQIVRFCQQCQLNVYNLSEMPPETAEEFLRNRAGHGRTCVRFFRRFDGTVITKDCPVGLAAMRDRVWRATVGGATLALSLLFSLVTGCSRSTPTPTNVTSGTTQTSNWPWAKPVPPPPTMLMGDVCIPTPPVVIVEEPETE